MSWILILVSLLPDIIDLVTRILDAIRSRPRAERPALRRELYAVARKHVRKTRSGRRLRTTGGDVHTDMQAFLDRLA